MGLVPVAAMMMYFILGGFFRSRHPLYQGIRKYITMDVPLLPVLCNRFLKEKATDNQNLKTVNAVVK